MQQACAPFLNPSFPLDTSGSALPFTNSQQQGNPLHLVTPSHSPVNPHNTIHPFFNAVSDATSQVNIPLFVKASLCSFKTLKVTTYNGKSLTQVSFFLLAYLIYFHFGIIRDTLRFYRILMKLCLSFINYLYIFFLCGSLGHFGTMICKM
jgi:hypothetical protein